MPQRLNDGGVTVPQDEGSPGSDEVNVGVAVNVKQLGALASLEEYGVAADSAKGAGWRVDSTGY